eukprot:14753057-Ditylum_brightwellii.AAC.1
MVMLTLCVPGPCTRECGKTHSLTACQCFDVTISLSSTCLECGLWHTCGDTIVGMQEVPVRRVVVSHHADCHAVRGEQEQRLTCIKEGYPSQDSSHAPMWIILQHVKEEAS